MSENEWEKPEPTWEKPCERCGNRIARYRGGGDVICHGDLGEGQDCGAKYNAAGQRLKDDAPVFGVGRLWGREDEYGEFDPYGY